MNLVVDIGNTQTKIALFDKNEHQKTEIVEGFSNEFLLNYLSNRNDIKSIIVSSVKNLRIDFEPIRQRNIFVIEFDENTLLPIINNYQSSKTLGKDRLAAAVGGYLLHQNENVLVIDAGTCIKYDFVDSIGNYEGGAISPGILMRFKALNTFTDKLPLVEKSNFNKLIGKTTEESILSGVFNGVFAEVDGIIDQYKQKFGEVKIVLSGGDMNYFDNRLKNSIFAFPNIVIFGLNKILNFNDKSNF
ncbi:MAG: type III pantothenate kinase [Bacteroidetes bacterium]|nr:type III pantothenate kinase [Bacteroidota bacterium]